MQFVENDFSIKIISVLLMDWDKNDITVSPRGYNAISFRIKGCAEFSDGTKTLCAADNDIVYMPEGVGYHLKSGFEKIIVIHFELSGKKQKYFEVITPDNVNSLKELFTEALATWNAKQNGYYLKTMSIFCRILVKLSRIQAESFDNSSCEKIKKAVRLMHTQFTDSRLTVSSLCRSANMSDTYFRRLFYEVYNANPNKYLTELRLSYAEELLNSGLYTVEATAFKSGFSDAKYFSKVFKKHYGHSPSENLKATYK